VIDFQINDELSDEREIKTWKPHFSGSIPVVVMAEKAEEYAMNRFVMIFLRFYHFEIVPLRCYI